MSSQVKLMIDQYRKMVAEAGFTSDQEVVNAWQQNPAKWSKLFSLRMNIISLLHI